MVRLDAETKQITHAIRMAAYNTETILARALAGHYARARRRGIRPDPRSAHHLRRHLPRQRRTARPARPAHRPPAHPGASRPLRTAQPGRIHLSRHRSPPALRGQTPSRPCMRTPDAMKERGLPLPVAFPRVHARGCLRHLRRWEAPCGSVRRPADRGHGPAPPTVGAGQDDRGWPEARHGADHQQPGAAGGGDRRAGLHPQVVLEACYGWYWAADTLAAAGAEVHLAHPLGVKAFASRRVKNDELDARDLADLLRMGRWRRRGSPRRRSASCGRSRGTGASWCTSAPAARTRSTACWPSSASR